MAQNVVYARATPKSISFKENYSYSSEISRNPSSQQNTDPTGQLAIEIPYDGENYFSRSALEDVKRQETATLSGDPNACIGYMVFPNSQHSDLDVRYSLRDHDGSLSLEIPLRQAQIASDDDLISDRFCARLDFDYNPRSLEVYPFNIEIDVFDEESIQQHLQQGDENLTERIARESMSRGFEPHLLFVVNVALVLPSRLGSKLSNTVSKISLKSFSLEWPFPTSQSYVSVFVEKQAVSLIYNPYQARIEWGGIQFGDGQKQEGTGSYVLSLPQMLLVVKQPGELYKKRTLKGRMVVDVPWLLSDVDATFYDVRGEKSNVNIETATQMVVDFDLYPDDSFARKIYAPYQHIHFEGLILEEARVADIRKALQDLGFDIRDDHVHSERDSSDASALKYCTIFGQRAEGPRSILLLLQAEGRVSNVTRERERYGSERFTTNVRAGQTVVYLRAEMSGDVTRLTHVLNEVQRLLKERLYRHVKLD